MSTKRYTRMSIPGLCLLAGFTCCLLFLPSSGSAAPVRVFANNDLGMHCYDPDFTVLSVLPPFNNIQAQVIEVGRNPRFLDDASVGVRYRAKADASGSINTTSGKGKTNFWFSRSPWFTSTPVVDVGLTGTRMPGPTNPWRPFRTFDPAQNRFHLEGLPITIYDDAKHVNPFPLYSIGAVDLTTRTLRYSLPTVVPASNEMSCLVCHKTGGVAANGTVDPTIVWSTVANLERQARFNILLLHNKRNNTTLTAPVRCSSCHYDKAVDLTNQGPQNTLPFLSRAMHGFHAPHIPQNATSLSTCANCHPAAPKGSTACLRGVMGTAGIVCISCHGNMFAVAKTTRRPWTNEPKCQSCHTGDANSNSGAIRFRKTYTGTAVNPTFRLAKNKRFAENANTLYRNSLGHNGVACESCHGSPHAEWPSRETNDNAAAIQLQGHVGPIIECKVCHGSALPATVAGPHGLHNINDRVWFNGQHEGFFENNRARCTACHGKSLGGTVLSRTAARRVFATEEGTFTLPKGTPVACNTCHEMP